MAKPIEEDELIQQGDRLEEPADAQRAQVSRSEPKASEGHQGGERGRAPARTGFRVVVSHERVTLPTGHEMLIDIVHHPGAAAVVPFTGDSEVALIRQYRHAAGGMILEVPAGKLDAGEPPEQCAARELAEEAGYRAGRIVALGSIWTTPGFTDEVIHLFAAFDLERCSSRPEDDEVIEVIRVPLERALDLVWRGELRDAKSALALIHAARHMGRLA